MPLNVLFKRAIKNLFPNKYYYHLADERLKSQNLSIKNIINVDHLPRVVIEDSVIEKYLKHQFNYLGSGWNSSNRNNEATVSSNHLATTNKIKVSIDDEHELIDWQKDSFIDFSFDITKQYNQQIVKEGVDIKHCWELGRLQHLPRLAFYALHSNTKVSFIKEFKNQTLDFIAHNPIGMGVQWACPMDVGIRVSNLLLAYDVFSQIDESNILDENFKTIFLDTIYLHGRFIYNHLEYKEGLTGNHYLFNLSGLLFIANYLNKNEEIVKWLNFSQSEIEKELDKQFFNDGGNFEGSTTYHCLAAEMMVYSTALMLRNNYNFKTKFINKLFKVGSFIDSIIKPNGEVSQFGDNDSGRYFKTTYVNNVDDENLLNYEGVLSSFDAIFKDDLFKKYTSNYSLENQIIKEYSGNRTLKKQLAINKYNLEIEKPIEELNYSKEHIIGFDTIDGLIDGLDFYHYPDFGIHVFKTNNFYLAISTISNKNMHHGWGHVHNDKLSFELFINGKDVLIDAGSYCYTSNPAMRNKFRSTKAHHTILIDGVEQNNFIESKEGLFYLDRESKCKVLEITKTSIKLMVEYYGVKHIRDFKICNNKLVITDYCNKPFVQNLNNTLLSNGYGKLINEN